MIEIPSQIMLFIQNFVKLIQHFLQPQFYFVLGRWKWGNGPSVGIKPPGAVLEANLFEGREEDAWEHLVMALSGLFCGSFHQILPKESKSRWNHATDVPWTEGGNNGTLRFASLPYEAVDEKFYKENFESKPDFSNKLTKFSKSESYQK